MIHDDLAILVNGYPGRSVHHGGLGWSSVCVVRHGGRVIMIDAGHFGMRSLIAQKLAELGLEPADVTDLLLTHAHHDHLINWPLFKAARVFIGQVEIEWAQRDDGADLFLPELYVEALAQDPRCHRIGDGQQVFPGVTAHLAPGHTPGGLVYRWQAEERDYIFTGDALSSRSEWLRLAEARRGGVVDPNPSGGMIWGLVNARPGTIVIPGHDLPFLVEAGGCRYVGERKAEVRASLGEPGESAHIFDLTGG